jgi:hypothetical protein
MPASLLRKVALSRGCFPRAERSCMSLLVRFVFYTPFIRSTLMFRVSLTRIGTGWLLMNASEDPDSHVGVARPVRGPLELIF